MFLADTLSRAFLPKASDDSQEEFETNNALSYLVMSDERVREIRQHTSSDPALQQLKRSIQEGRADKKLALPSLVTPYFSIRDELAVPDGLVFRGERLVIPKSLRSEIKKDIHRGHQGVELCLRRAREHVFWPGMNEELKEWIQTCETWREFEQTHCKETLMSHEIPDRPWEKIAADLFTYRDKEYLITVCYKSNFWELDLLYDTKSSTVIKKLTLPDMASPSSWLVTTAHSLFLRNSTSSPRAGVSSTQQPLPTTAKPMAKSNRRRKLPNACFAKLPNQAKINTWPYSTSGMYLHKA